MTIDGETLVKPDLTSAIRIQRKFTKESFQIRKHYNYTSKSNQAQNQHWLDANSCQFSRTKKQSQKSRLLPNLPSGFSSSLPSGLTKAFSKKTKNAKKIEKEVF